MPNDKEALATTVENAIHLTSELQKSTSSIFKSPNQVEDQDQAGDGNDVDPLSLLRDSTSLIKAHTTKLSLLLINEPFTPSAVCTVIRELIAKPIPALATAVQTCRPATYTALYRQEVAWRTQKLLSELVSLFQKIPKDGKALTGAQRSSFVSGQRGSLAATGILWSACDDVVKITNLGVAGFFLLKVEQWKDTLKDVMDELKEWGDEDPEEQDDDEDDDGDFQHSDDEGGDSAQDMLDELMNSQQSIPKDDPDGIRPRLDSSLRRIRLVTLLYQAIARRRLKKLPGFPTSAAEEKNVPQRLDELASVLQKLPSQFSDLALCFYELDPKSIDDSMDQCFFDAFAASELLGNDWKGARDEFTDWAEKFQQEIKKSE